MTRELVESLACFLLGLAVAALLWAAMVVCL